MNYVYCQGCGSKIAEREGEMVVVRHAGRTITATAPVLIACAKCHHTTTIAARSRMEKVLK